MPTDPVHMALGFCFTSAYGGVLVTCFVAVIKYLDKSNLRKYGFISVYNLKGHSLLQWEVWGVGA